MVTKLPTISFSDLLATKPTELTIPDFEGISSILECARAYIENGWWVVPVSKGTKNPGSILGKNWPSLSSNSAHQIDQWFASYPNRGLALHMGKSGAIAVDVDNADCLSHSFREVLSDSHAPFQSTRVSETSRGHYVYSLMPGESFTNSTRAIGAGWGEIRSGNSVIMAYPSFHPDEGAGARYAWQNSGSLPCIPEYLRERLIPSRHGLNRTVVSELDDSQLESKICGLTQELAAGLLQMRVEDAKPRFRRGSRHDALRAFLWFGFRDAKAGLFPGLSLIDAALKLFLEFKPKDEWSSPREFWDLVRWTVSVSDSLTQQDLDEARSRGLAYAAPGISNWLKVSSNA